MRRALLALAIALALAASARADRLEGIENFVYGLPNEAQECDFLRQLCDGAVYSLRRYGGTPPNLDFLAARQGLIADARVVDATTAARVMLGKRGHRLSCFDEPHCKEVLPDPLTPIPDAKRK